MNSTESGKREGALLLGVVVDKFTTQKSGLVLVVDVDAPPAKVSPGDTVEIRWPGGRSLHTRLDDVSLAGGTSRSTIGMHLPEEMHSVDVTRGAQVWKHA